MSKMNLFLFGIVLLLGTYVLYENRPKLVENAKVQGKVVVPKKEISSDASHKKIETVQGALSTKVMEPPKKTTEEKPKKLKPHHLYVKSDMQMKKEFEERRERHKKFRLRQENQKNQNKTKKGNGNV